MMKCLSLFFDPELSDVKCGTSPLQTGRAFNPHCLPPHCVSFLKLNKCLNEKRIMRLLFKTVLGDISQIFKLYFILWIGYCIKVYMVIYIYNGFIRPLYLYACVRLHGARLINMDERCRVRTNLPFGNKYFRPLYLFASSPLAFKIFRTGSVRSQPCSPTMCFTYWLFDKDICSIFSKNLVMFWRV